jgi:5'(3')-deoxyribonucleotidase
MDRKKILKLAEKNIPLSNLEIVKKILEREYLISYGKYSASELKKAISGGSPLYIENNFITGFENNKFINSENKEIPVERDINAIIVEDEKDHVEESTSQIVEPAGDYFAIVNRNEWDQDIQDFIVIFGDLRVGVVFLPPHSAVFNFIKPTEKEIKSRVVSMLSGITINVYSRDNYVDNCIHEVGHLFWRDCLKYKERKAFGELYKNLKPSAIYEYEWERSNEEEVFCTIYKWYLKSLLINRSFMNILEFEESAGLNLLQAVFDRIARDKMISDLWEIQKDDIYAYLNPKYDVTSGKYIRKSGVLDQIKDIELPDSVLSNIEKLRYGIEYVNLGKAVVPVNGNKIDFEKISKSHDWRNINGLFILEKASTGPLYYDKKNRSVNKDGKPTIYFDMDGVVADFVSGYKGFFDRNAYKDDKFTINQACCTQPNFFRNLPVIEKGKEIYDLLKDRYHIIFLTTPMEGMAECKRDKLEWVRENFPGSDVIFSSQKEDYVIDLSSILIDDMDYNLDPWCNAGGTAINFNQKIDKIIDTIDDIFNDKKEVESVNKQLSEMEVNTEPTEEQKKSGNYKKGEIVFKGMRIKIENPKGSIRFGFSDNGVKWVQRMNHHYGYIAGTDGADNDPVDCFIGPKLNASRAFVVNQGYNEMFDEHKIMLGFENIDEAEDAYFSNYKKGWDGLMSIKQTNTKQLREWLRSGNKNEPF